MIWVIGYKGMLGAELSALFLKLWMPHIISGRDVDITNTDSLRAFAEKQNKIGWIVNCAAYRPAGGAGYDADSCRAANTDGPANVARLAKKLQAKLVHISADSVFSGKGIYSEELRGLRPYRENDEAGPSGVFGIAKRDGEQLVRKNNRASYIIRTAWLYGNYGDNFVSGMLRLMRESGAVFADNSRRGSPTWAYDLALAIAALIRTSENGKHIPYGIYHYTSDGDITQLDFARRIHALGRELNLLDRDCDVSPGTGMELPAEAAVPGYFVLDKKKIRLALHIKPRAWDSSLLSYMKSLRSEQKQREAGENARD